MTCEEGHVGDWPQLGGWSTCAHQELQGTRGSMEDSLQHSRDEELVQHPLHSAKVLHMQDGGE